MPAVQTQANPPTFESVWALMQENALEMEKFRESMKEDNRQQKERWAEADRRREEDRLKAEKDREDFNNRLGSMTNLFGEMTESMIAPKICKKFEELGLYFPKANPNSRVNDRVNNISFEIDLMLENGDKAMLIEVKTKLTIDRINKHIERMEKNRRYADLHGDKRTFLGAVAGIVVTDEIREYALDQGFYFIEYEGENFSITPPSEKAKEW